MKLCDVYTFFEDDRCLTITDMRWEMVGHFSHEADETIILQSLNMQKVCAQFVPRQLAEERQKNYIGAALNLFTQ